MSQIGLLPITDYQRQGDVNSEYPFHTNTHLVQFWRSEVGDQGAQWRVLSEGRFPSLLLLCGGKGNATLWLLLLRLLIPFVAPPSSWSNYLPRDLPSPTPTLRKNFGRDTEIPWKAAHNKQYVLNTSIHLALSVGPAIITV